MTWIVHVEVWLQDTATHATRQHTAMPMLPAETCLFMASDQIGHTSKAMMPKPFLMKLNYSMYMYNAEDMEPARCLDMESTAISI